MEVKRIKMLHQILLILLIGITSLFSKASGLKISSIEVPAAVMNSSNVTLICNYDLQGDQLYSVKWYKNYVEFYRFQPSDLQQNGATAPGSAQSQTSSTQSDNQLHSKQEFELEGINLNLSKSNATHVYLQQVNLASEGTYKCELDAESSSFATISMERQMKVYVLPKQKLSIVDNSMSTSTPSPTNLNQQQQQQQRSLAEQQTMKPTLIYNINDFVNLTCVSSASKPAAKLTWLLNDTPVSATSKWLQHSTTSKTQQSGEQLLETKLTLAFRLQPNHLLKGNNIASGGSIEPSSRYQSLKARCVSELSVQFSSESSIIVSGGKTTMKKNKEVLNPSSILPAPSSLSSQREQSITDAGGSRNFPTTSTISNTLTSNPEYPIYRWPRPLTVPTSNGRQNNRKNSPSLEPFSDPWITSSARLTSSSTDLEDSDSALLLQRTGSRANSRHLVVWTNRQLRDQAEHIDLIMRLAHPNELDTPLIEGKIQFEDSSDALNYGNMATEQGAGFGTDSRTSVDADSLQETFTTTTMKPTISVSNPNQDYELDDLVQFTCKPRFNSAEINSIKRVTSKWSINDKEISVNLVNTFDGHKFSYSRDLYDIAPTNRPRFSTQQYLNPSTSNDTTSEGNDVLNLEQSENPTTTQLPQTYSPSKQQNHLNQSSLLVEFSSSLFQLKELNLKCRTIVEQPLIQYDSQVVISVPTNQFIQADQNNSRHRAGGAFYRNPTSRHNGRIYNNNGNYKARNSNAHRSSSNAAALKFNWPYCLLIILINPLTARHLVRLTM